MGQRMPDIDIEYGDDCFAIFPANLTPKFLYVRFSEVVACPGQPGPPPNQRLLKLEQKPLAACAYSWEDSNWVCSCDLNAVGFTTQILLFNKPDTFLYFTARVAAPITEGQVFANESLGCPAGRGGKDGICVVTWSPQATALLAGVVIEKSADLFMEIFPKPNGDLVYKFCRTRDSTNIKFLYKP